MIPDAVVKIAFDRFHVARHLGDAVDKVRRGHQVAVAVGGRGRKVHGEKLAFARLRAVTRRTAWALGVDGSGREPLELPEQDLGGCFFSPRSTPDALVIVPLLVLVEGRAVDTAQYIQIGFLIRTDGASGGHSPHGGHAVLCARPGVRRPAGPGFGDRFRDGPGDLVDPPGNECLVDDRVSQADVVAVALLEPR